MRRADVLSLIFKATPLWLPILLFFYNPNREASLPLDSKIVGISASQGKITDRLTIIKVVQILSDHNRGYWDRGRNNCPSPTATARFDVTEGAAPLTLMFGPNWVCANANFGGKIESFIWHIPPEKELELRRLLAINA